jgi:ABC-type Fe3+/spermidine/putrescine transport system ATPase subunit
MDRGDIAEIGKAEALYRRPSSEFVARFIGRANHVTARAIVIDRGGADVDIGGAPLRVPGVCDEVATGYVARLLIRSELAPLE